jgi:chromosome segregation ATPase
LSQPPSDSTAPESAPGGEKSRSGDPEALLSEARRQLRAALDTLDHAIGRQAERAREQADRAAEYSALQEDRSRLAQELDAALTRIGDLERAIGEAARRIERASAAVRAVLSADDAREG